MGAVRLHIGVNGGAFAQQRTAYFQRIGGVFTQSTGLIALFFAPAQINTGAGVDRGVMSKTHGHHFNMFVMKKELLQHYCTWLFDILFELEKELDISSYSTNDKRVFGFVSEHLLDAWLITNNIAYEELDVVYMESQHWLRKGMAFLNRKFFPHKEAHK